VPFVEFSRNEDPEVSSDVLGGVVVLVAPRYSLLVVVVGVIDDLPFAATGCSFKPCTDMLLSILCRELELLLKEDL
jgi:hypothetical protein